LVPKRILILDDNQDILEIVQEILRYEDFEVKAISEAKHVLAVAEAFQPDLLLLDYKLPDGNGAEICRSFKSLPAFEKIPVIIFSAYTHPNLNFNDFGCDDIIAKPFDLDQLTNTIHRHLSE
jgi:DNA-binding response OmpR family regulator